MSSLKDAALAYAARGWPVLPLRGKLPAIAKANGGRGVHDATTDNKQITEWWQKWPQANVGIACGKPSGFWVFDIDSRHDGDESLEELEHKHGALPATVEQFTGGGGRHILFRHDGEAVRNRANITPGLDVRGDGGYIVVEPSLHPDTKQVYAWNVDQHPDEVELAPAPNWLGDLVAGKKSSNGSDQLADRFIAAGSPVRPVKVNGNKGVFQNGPRAHLIKRQWVAGILENLGPLS